MGTRGVVAAPFFSLFRRGCVEQYGLQILVRKVLTLAAVMTVMWVTVSMIFRGPNIKGVEYKRCEAKEEHGETCDGAEATNCVMTVSPAGRSDTNRLD